ncbi:MAG: pyridoxal phosphate-dependent aminotransferase [Armatimonadota bacterium]
MHFAERMDRLGTETAFEVLAKAKALEAQGRDIIHLEIGEPDFDTPANICEAANKALLDGQTHYCPSGGIPELREAVAEYISTSRGFPADPDEVVITPGAKPIIFFGILACVDEGDEVIWPDPGFPIYPSVVDFVDAKPVSVVLREENEFRFDVDDLAAAITPKTRMIIINSPQNPTGGALTKEDLERIADLAIKHDIIVMSDEPYCQMQYEGEHSSIAALDGMKERTILIDGFSKTYAMTGWRLGYGVCDKELAAKIGQLVTNSCSCTPTFIQHAGVEALRGPQDESRKMVAEFKKRRDVVVEGLNSLPGMSCISPKGAFYAFPNATGYNIDCREMAAKILDEGGVAVLSGTAFGEGGDGYLRLSYANSIENIEEAIARMKPVVEPHVA